MAPTTLKLKAPLRAVLNGIAEQGGSTDASTILVVPFPFPSVGTTFARVEQVTGQERKSLFVKTFDPKIYFVKKGAKNGQDVWRRLKTRLPPAVLEHIYLEAYRKHGCPVPASEVMNNFTIAMEDCGKVSLEERLRGKTIEEQEKELATLIPSQVKFAIAGRKIRIPYNAKDRVMLYSSLPHDFKLLHRYWRPGASSEEVTEFLDRTSFLREFTEKQYFLGDNSTFHIFFGEDGTARWVDLERLKLGHPSREPAGLYFSPECAIGFEAIERLLHDFKTQEAQAEPSDADWKRYLGQFYKSGVVECFRRGTRIRELEHKRPEIYGEFIRKHAGYTNAFSRYQEKIAGITIKIRNNGLFNSEEREAFGRAGDAILDLISR